MQQQTETITREQLHDNAHIALKNLIDMLPETIPYHPDTKMRVDFFPYSADVQRVVFTAEIILVTPAHPA